MNNQPIGALYGDGSQARAEFKLSITRALSDQLGERLNSLHPAFLNQTNLDQIEDRPGVYQLYLSGALVYVGKASRGLPSRLANHLKKLSGRTNLNIHDIGYVCLYVDEDLEAAAPEKLLITKYRSNGEAPWNTMGFGNKDPGRNRDETLVKANHFDARYPVDIDRKIDGLALAGPTLGYVLKAAKADLPFTFRYETKNKSLSKQLNDALVIVPPSRSTATELMLLTIQALPDGWQATALPGYMILYHETKEYGSARLFWRRVDGQVEQFTGQARLDESGEVDPPVDDDDE
ncbi:MAG: restriction endonuclease [Nocardia sp.]|uniref:Eco29kI family restriction endonuclease n=1 Tax=Nocardia sp. TaxID=1821 RepID=UPI002609DC17|nr:Eco29kI family restriction endonuclease [Nocardia sp.]MCU1641084.1 restriction endonuclease [Nocardia sp.]